MYKQVVTYAQHIRKDKLENKFWIYVDKDLNVHLLNKLPNEYWIKGDILTVWDPEKYLYEVNKRKATKNELDQFRLIEPITKDINKLIYGKVIPPELIREHLLSLPIKDIVRSRTISKEFKNIIDKNEFWCKLIQRDFPEQPYDENNCYDSYKEMYPYKNLPFLSYKRIKEIAKKYNANVDDLSYLLDFLHYSGKTRYGRYFEPSYVLNGRSFPIDIASNRKIRIYAIEFNFDRIPDKIKLLNELLPTLFHIDDDITIPSFKDFMDLYNKAYNNNFDKDFIKSMVKSYRDIERYNATPQQLLKKYHVLAK